MAQSIGRDELDPDWYSTETEDRDDSSIDTYSHSIEELQVGVTETIEDKYREYFNAQAGFTEFPQLLELIKKELDES